MALIADTSGLYAAADASDRWHKRVRATLEAETGAVVVPVAILAEIAYLLELRLGTPALLAFLRDLDEGNYVLDLGTDADLGRMAALVEQYRDLSLGLADAAVAATAERLGVYRLLTLDERHFRAVRPSGQAAFTILPADAPRR